MPQSKNSDGSEGAEPDAFKGASPVLNGGDEETGRKALRLVPTQPCALHPGARALRAQSDRRAPTPAAAPGQAV